jgi:PadR family transcriptional regulator, regulatory protein PadR
LETEVRGVGIGIGDAKHIRTGPPFDIPKEVGYSFGMAKEAGARKTDVLQGTLDLMVLQSLNTMGLQHGYGIARRIEQISESTLKLNEGTVYASLMRLQLTGLITSRWGTSENNRRAKFYAITKRGKRQLSAETENWNRIAWVIGRLLGTTGGL